MKDTFTRQEAYEILMQCAKDLRAANQSDWLAGGGNVKGPKTKSGAIKRAAEVVLGKRESYFSKVESQ